MGLGPKEDLIGPLKLGIALIIIKPPATTPPAVLPLIPRLAGYGFRLVRRGLERYFFKNFIVDGPTAERTDRGGIHGRKAHGLEAQKTKCMATVDFDGKREFAEADTALHVVITL